MKLYRSYITSADLIFNYASTLKEAHTAAKSLTPRSEARVELVDVSTDKAGVIALLNSAQLFAEQAWSLTPRGGLTDCVVGE